MKPVPLYGFFACRPVLLDYLHVVAQVVRVPGPMGNTFNFSKYVGLDPAPTLYPPPPPKKKYKDYQAYPKIFSNAVH